MSYGQAITPKIFHDTSVQTLTKAAYAHKVAKALVAVGMKLLQNMSSYDVLDARYEEGTYEFGGQIPFVFFFDFPTAETFTVDGTVYRPCLGMRWNGESYNPTVADGHSHETFVFDLCARPDGVTDCTRIRSEQYWRTNGTFGYGLGGSTQAYPVYQDGAMYYNFRWLPSNRATWASYIGTYSFAPIVVGNLFVALGPGGLTVHSGRSTALGEFAQYHSFTILFMGERIPGRGLMTDPNLSRCNPTILMAHRTSSANNVATPGQFHHRAFVVGCQYDLKVPAVVDSEKKLGLVAMLLFNLVNLEDNESNIDKYVYVHDSPRLVLGVGRHLLEPIVGYTQDEINFTTNLFGRLNPNVGLVGLVCPPWADYFYAPKARWADNTAPLGKYVDPDTGEDWYIVPPLFTGAKLALNVEGATDVTFTPVPAFGAYTTENFDVSSAGYASVFPRTVSLQTFNNGPAEVWAAGVGGQNAQTISYAYYSVSAYRQKTWSVLAPNTDDPEDLYEFVFNFYVRTTQAGAPPATSAAPHLSVWVNDVFGYVNSGVSLIFPAGRSTGENYYDLTEVVLPVPRSHRSDYVLCLTNYYNISFHAYSPSSNVGGTYSIRIENLRLRRRKRV